MAEKLVMVFFEIPNPELNANKYQKWFDGSVLRKWLVEKEGNEEYGYRNTGKWNQEGSIAGYFDGKFFASCKFYKFDGTASDWERKRCAVIRDHAYLNDVAEKVGCISDRFEEFLIEETIEYNRQDFFRDD